MGMNALLLVRGDGLGGIKADVNIGDKIDHAIAYGKHGSSISSGCCANAIDVVITRMHEQYEPYLIVVEGGTAYPLYDGGSIPEWSKAERLERRLVSILEQRGYTVTKVAPN